MRPVVVACLLIMVTMISSVRGLVSPRARTMMGRHRLMSTKKSHGAESGKAYFVATPIGNLGDITLRAIEVLASADIIACEDTRHTRKLLSHLDITPKRVVSHHEHNAHDSAVGLVALLKEGNSIALVSDAGTPGISDPGTELAATCAKEGIPCVPIPGPSAVVSALSVCGFHSSTFTFFGFLPVKGKARQEKVQDIGDTKHSVVLYEAPHRMIDTMNALAALEEGKGGARQVCVCRELTKIHEEVKIGSVQDIISWLESGAGRSLSSDVEGQRIKGEFCLVIAPKEVDAEEESGNAEQSAEHALTAMREDGVSRSEAVKLCSKQMPGISKSAVYKLALQIEGWAAQKK